MHYNSDKIDVYAVLDLSKGKQRTLGITVQLNDSAGNAHFLILDHTAVLSANYYRRPTRPIRLGLICANMRQVQKGCSKFTLTDTISYFATAYYH